MLADLESPLAGVASSWPIASRSSVVRCQSPWPRQRASRRLLNYRTAGPILVGTILTRCPRCRRGLTANRSRAHVRASRAIACPTKESDPGKTPQKCSGCNDGCSRLDFVSKAVWRLHLSEQKLSDSKGCILSTTGADKEPNSGKLHLQGETHGFEET